MVCVIICNKEMNMRYFLITFDVNTQETECFLADLLNKTKNLLNTLKLNNDDFSLKQHKHVIFIVDTHEKLTENFLADMYRKEIIKKGDFLNKYHGKFNFFVKEVNDDIGIV